jgi:hypothetical protein
MILVLGVWAFVRALLGCSAAVTLENVALRHQLGVLPRPSPRPSATWRAFLEAHIRDIVAVDFFVVPTLTFRLLFGFLILRYNRRELVHVNVTDHPTAAWAAHQLVESFPEETAPTYLLRDRDAIYGDVTCSHGG